MMGLAALGLFLLCGVLISDALFRRRARATRLYLGLTLGVVMLMWFPSLFAFWLDFTRTAQYLAMGLAALLALAACMAPALRVKTGLPAISRHDDEPPLTLVLWLVIPMTVLSAWLQYTHTLRPVEGALHVGQSTYGDLCLHLGIATGLRGASYPPEYTLLPGTQLGYPFLADAMSASLLMLGMPLNWAFIVPGVLMMGLVYWGFVLLAWELTRSRLAVGIAFLLVFFNGGLGFLYTLDGAASDPSRLWEALFGYYRTPANYPDLNLRWSNVVADLMIPQRTLLAGWVMVIPALWLLASALKSGRRVEYVMLGVWAGAMPLVHTHSYVALVLISLGVGIYQLCRSKHPVRETLINFGLYAGIAALLSIPQLLTWTFPQSLGESSGITFRFNWVNWNGNGLIDGYIWFWVKNVGLAFLLLVPAALSGSRRQKSLALGALVLFAAAELVQFQTNAYDNNKLFYVAFILMMPMVGQYIAMIFKKLKGVKGRSFLLGVFLLVSTLSGGISLTRECIGDYQLFSKEEAGAAQYIDQNTEKDAVFLTGTQHNNPVAALAGRKIVCGTSHYLHFHGLSYARQEADVRLMLEMPEQSAQLFEKYGVDYVYVSSYERSSFAVDEEYFASHAKVCYEEGDVILYKLEE